MHCFCLEKKTKCGEEGGHHEDLEDEKVKKSVGNVGDAVTTIYIENYTVNICFLYLAHQTISCQAIYSFY